MGQADQQAEAGRRLWAAHMKGWPLGRLVPLSGGEVNATFRIDSGYDSFVLRYPLQTPADWLPTIDGQLAAMNLARGAGVPVPEVIFASVEVMIYRYLPGEPIPDSCTDDVLAFEAGRLHGRLHGVHAMGIGPVQADGSSPDWGPETATRAVPEWSEALCSHPESVMDPRQVEEAANLVIRMWRPQRSCLLHGDASVWNTLAVEGKPVALIDFDDTWYGDPAGDMAWWWWSSPGTADAFVAGCQSEAEETDPLILWLFRLRHLLGMGSHLLTTDFPERREKSARLLGVALEAIRHLV